MRDELSKVPRQKKKALDRAIFLKPSLETDDKFHMMFLRAERFDPAKAAESMYRHFEYKLLLFGDDKLTKKITLDDLTEEEMICMRSGSTQLLRDRQGRGVCLFTFSVYDVSNWKTQLRYNWYQIMTVLEENEEIQKKGVVKVVNCFGEWRSSVGQFIDFILKTERIIAAWPFRTCAFHLCYDQPAVRTFLNLVHVLVGKNGRLRERTHFGSKLEVQYTLMQFGVNLQHCLSPGEGVLSQASIEAYIRERQEKEAAARRLEEQSATPGFALFPTKMDVLCGRGPPFHSWHGNAHLTGLVIEYAEQYMEATERVTKTLTTIHILNSVKQGGGRFLRRTTEGWEEVPEKAAQEKISQIMRAELRKRRSALRDPVADSTTSSPEEDISSKRIRMQY